MPKILLVEDNMFNQEGLSRLLGNKYGFEVVAVADGASALAIFLELKPDVILMDLSLPDIDGLEVTRKIREKEIELDMKPIGIIALTAHAMHKDRVEAIESGCTDFETKPVDILRLVGKIKSAIASR
jgi:CheY-like chemotaxis protein